MELPMMFDLETAQNAIDRAYDAMLATCTRVVVPQIPKEGMMVGYRTLPESVDTLKIVVPKFVCYLQHEAKTTNECVAYAEGYFFAIAQQIADKHSVAGVARSRPEIFEHKSFERGATTYRVHARAHMFLDTVEVKVSKNDV